MFKQNTHTHKTNLKWRRLGTLAVQLGLPSALRKWPYQLVCALCFPSIVSWGVSGGYGGCFGDCEMDWQIKVLVTEAHDLNLVL